MTPSNRKVSHNSYLLYAIIFLVPNIVTGILFDLAIFLFPKSSLIGWILLALTAINWIILIIFIIIFTDYVYKCGKYDLLVGVLSLIVINIGMQMGEYIIAPALKLSLSLGVAIGLYLPYTIMIALKYYACSLSYHSKKLKVSALLALTQVFSL